MFTAQHVRAPLGLGRHSWWPRRVPAGSLPGGSARCFLLTSPPSSVPDTSAPRAQQAEPDLGCRDHGTQGDRPHLTAAETVIVPDSKAIRASAVHLTLVSKSCVLSILFKTPLPLRTTSLGPTLVDGILFNGFEIFSKLGFFDVTLAVSTVPWGQKLKLKFPVVSERWAGSWGRRLHSGPPPRSPEPRLAQSAECTARDGVGGGRALPSRPSLWDRQVKSD